MKNFEPTIRLDLIPVWCEQIKERVNVIRIQVTKEEFEKPEFYYYQFSNTSALNGVNSNDVFYRLFYSLTKREKEVLHYVAAGLTSSDISVRLGITLNTVKNHRKNFKKKLNFSDSINYSKFLRWVALL